MFDFLSFIRNQSQSYNFCSDQDCCGGQCCDDACDPDNPDNWGSCERGPNEEHFINPKMDAIADQVRFNAMLRNDEMERFGMAMQMVTMAMSLPDDVPEKDKYAALGVALNSIAKFYPEFAAAFRQYRAPR